MNRVPETPVTTGVPRRAVKIVLRREDGWSSIVKSQKNKSFYRRAWRNDPEVALERGGISDSTSLC